MSPSGERLISAEKRGEDQTDTTLRPLALSEFVGQAQDIAPYLVGRRVELLLQPQRDGIQRQTLGQQLPDAGAHRVQPEVDAALQLQQDAFALNLPEQHLGVGGEDATTERFHDRQYKQARGVTNRCWWPMEAGLSSTSGVLQMSQKHTLDTSADKTPAPKRQYSTPRLIEHGDLRRIALAKGGSKFDGAGKPVTKF